MVLVFVLLYLSASLIGFLVKTWYRLLLQIGIVSTSTYHNTVRRIDTELDHILDNIT